MIKDYKFKYPGVVKNTQLSQHLQTLVILCYEKPHEL